MRTLDAMRGVAPLRGRGVPEDRLPKAVRR
jgi:hypothetical protein